MSAPGASTEKAAAWRVHRKGALPQVMRKDTLDVPTPGEGEVLVKVHAAALNPVDWKVAAHAPSFAQKLPRVLGIDLVGRVLSVGSGVTTLKAGDTVLGMVPVPESSKTGRGSLATHALVRAEHAAVLPPALLEQYAPSSASGKQPGSGGADGRTLADLAGLPLVACTALSCARRAAAGDRVLVLGGSTSVGAVLLQMLRAEGVQNITATASGEKIKFVIERGASEVIDYREKDVVSELKRLHSSPDAQFDAVLDCVGDMSVHRSCGSYLKAGREYFVVGASYLSASMGLGSLLRTAAQAAPLFVLPRWAGGVPRKSAFGGPAHEELQAIVDQYVASGKVTPATDSCFAFDDAQKAYERLMTGRALGKVLVLVE